MALYSTLVAGTTATWQASGGTYTLTLTSLASAAARQGAKGDLSDLTASNNLPEVLMFLFETKAGAAVANATNKLTLLIGESNSGTAGTNNPAGLTGSDASLGTPAEYTLQLNRAGALNMSNNAATGAQKQWIAYYPTSRYIIPVVYNQTNQSLSGTAGDHILTMVPYFRVQNSV